MRHAALRTLSGVLAAGAIPPYRQVTRLTLSLATTATSAATAAPYRTPLTARPAFSSPSCWPSARRPFSATAAATGSSLGSPHDPATAGPATAPAWPPSPSALIDVEPHHDDADGADALASEDSVDFLFAALTAPTTVPRAIEAPAAASASTAARPWEAPLSRLPPAVAQPLREILSKAPVGREAVRLPWLVGPQPMTPAQCDALLEAHATALQTARDAHVAEADLADMAERFRPLELDALAESGQTEALIRRLDPQAYASHRPDVSKPPLADTDAAGNHAIIKSLVRRGEREFAFMQYMRARDTKVVLARETYEELLACLVTTKQYARATRFFHFVTTERYQASEALYAMAIYAYGQLGEIERALDIYQQMGEAQVNPTEVTLAALLSGFGMRDDYYKEAWAIFETLACENASYVPSPSLYAIFFGIAARQGDIFRFRQLWNRAAQSEHAADLLSVHQLHLLLRCYARGIKDITRDQERQAALGYSLLAAAQRQHPGPAPIATPLSPPRADASPSSDANEAPSSAPDPPSAAESAVDVPSEAALVPADAASDTAPSPQPWTPVSDDCLSVQELAAEAERLWQRHVDPALPVVASRSAPPARVAADGALVFPMTQGLFHARIALLCAQKSDVAGLDEAVRLWEAYPAMQHGSGWGLLLHSAVRHRAKMLKHGQHLITAWQAWDAEKEATLMAAHGPQSAHPLTAAECDELRAAEGRNTEYSRTHFIFAVRGYTRLDDFEQVFATIDQVKHFRYPGYLKPIVFKDIRSTVTKITHRAEDGELSLVRRLVEVCPDPGQSLRQKLQVLMSTHRNGTDWWGWEVLGVSPTEKERIYKVQKMRERRVKQIKHLQYLRTTVAKKAKAKRTALKENRPYRDPVAKPNLSSASASATGAGS